MSTETAGATDAADATAESSEEAEESGPAEDYGIKVGVPIGLLAAYVFVLGPDRAVALSDASDEIVGTTGAGAEPFLQLAIAALGVTFVGGFAYPVLGKEVYEDYRNELTIGTIFAPAAVVILVFGAVLLDPAFVDLLAGDVAGALFYLAIALVIVGVLVISNVGLLAILVVFGIYLGIPAAVGTYAGTFLGELVS